MGRADELVHEILATPEGQRDPYPRYEALRALAPRHRSSTGRIWYLTGYADCHQVLRDGRLGKDPDGRLTDLVTGTVRERRDIGTPPLLFLNPPDHTRLRRLVSRGFTPRRVAALEARVAAMTDQCLDELADAGSGDLLDVLGFPLPVRVIGELVGVPPEDRDRFRPLVRAAATNLEPGVTPEQLDASAAAIGEMAMYFWALLEERRRAPRDDLISALAEVEDGGDRLSEEELIATVILLFAAGFETTTNLIGNGVATLLGHPDELARLRSDPDLAPAAIEEMLRYESPVQLDARTALEPTDTLGLPLEPGDVVVTLLGAANRDPAVNADPQRFDIGRPEITHLAFATGIHHCLGAALSRIEGRVVLERLLARFGSIELAEDTLPWRDTITLRGLERLPVTVSAKATRSQ